jgi:hypothetical protein
MIVKLKRDIFNNTGRNEIVVLSEVKVTEQCHCTGEDSLLLGSCFSEELGYGRFGRT